MSTTNAPPRSPPRPSSASATTTASSTSLRSTIYPSSSGGDGERRGVDDSGGWGGASTTASSSVSASQFPFPPGHFQQPHFAQQHSHQHPHRHHQHQPHHGQQQLQQQQPHARRQSTGAPPLHLVESTHPNPPPSSSTANILPSSLPSPTNPTHLPTPSQASQTAQARAALVASLGNTLDTELSSRASLLHANQAAIEKQERDVQTALGAFRKENDKLAKVLADGSRQVKELGDVQNWAERLERDFLVLEETMRLVQRGEGEGGSLSGSGSYSGSESGSWSGSEDEGEGEGEEQHRPGSEHHDDLLEQDTHMTDVHGDIETPQRPVDLGIKPTGKDKGKGKAKELDGDETPTATGGDAMDIETEEHHHPAEVLPSNTTETSSGVHHESPTAPPQTTAGTGWLRRFTWRGS